MHDEDRPKESQQEPQQDSALQTPQPDQPHPPVSDQNATEDPNVDVDVDVSVENPGDSGE
jgi:hypothetical protein